MFLFLVQSQFDLIMVINVVGGYDYYVILSDWLCKGSTVRIYGEVWYCFECLATIVTAFPYWHLIKSLTAMTNQFPLHPIMIITIMIVFNYIVSFTICFTAWFHLIQNKPVKIWPCFMVTENRVFLTLFRLHSLWYCLIQMVISIEFLVIRFDD